MSPKTDLELRCDKKREANVRKGGREEGREKAHLHM